MRIPKRFNLHGQTIDIVWDDNIRNIDDANGSAVFRKNEIRLQKPSKQLDRPKEAVEQTFCHELVHWIFFSNNEKYDDKDGWLHQDEDIVVRTSALLHQALTSMEYK